MRDATDVQPFADVVLNQNDKQRLHALRLAIVGAMREPAYDAEDWFLLAGVVLDINKEIATILGKYVTP